MRNRLTVLTIISLVTVAVVAKQSYSFREAVANATIADAAADLIELSTAAQTRTMILPANSPKRMGWHFIPKDERKGLQVRDMNEKQVDATHQLLKTVLSELGYDKTKEIMRLEGLLNELEGGKGGNIRDPLRYYVTFFGKPSSEAAWGLSFEGHHLSLNYWFDGEKIVASTPQFFAANPATIKNKNNSDFRIGSAVLGKEEGLGFELVGSLTENQRGKAILASKARREIRAAGEAQPPQTAPEGINIGELTAEQRDLLESLIDEYIAAMPEEVANQRREEVDSALAKGVYFAWEGATKPGIGHYYRVQGPTFLIEFVNTQPDAAGNPANHIHCVWRDLRGDFGIKIK